MLSSSSDDNRAATDKHGFSRIDLPGVIEDEALKPWLQFVVDFEEAANDFLGYFSVFESVLIGVHLWPKIAGYSLNCPIN